MRKCHLVAMGVLLTVALSGAPAAAQEAGSPAPSPAPSVPTTSPAPSAPPGPAISPPARGVRWAPVRDQDVRRAGVLWHAVTLGDEVIALATGATARGQGRVRVLATPDGTTWVWRGTIRLTGTVDALLADGGSLYAVGWDEGAMIWRSDDAGATWTRPADLAPFAAGADGLPSVDEGATVEAITRGPASLVAVGTAIDPDTLARRAAAWRSADGLTWERLAEVGALPPLHAIASDATVYVAAGSSITAATSPPGADAPVLRWSVDGRTWTDAVAEIHPFETIEGVSGTLGLGFLAWGSQPANDTGAAQARIWSSADGRTWERWPDDAALAGVDISAVRSLEGGALTMAVGGVPLGAFALPLFPDRIWRRDRISARDAACVRDVASVRAILVAVGGTCGAPRQRGRAWTTPLEP